jgi:hypothetical protein
MLGDQMALAFQDEHRVPKSACCDQGPFLGIDGPQATRGDLFFYRRCGDCGVCGRVWSGRLRGHRRVRTYQAGVAGEVSGSESRHSVARSVQRDLRGDQAGRVREVFAELDHRSRCDPRRSTRFQLGC